MDALLSTKFFPLSPILTSFKSYSKPFNVKSNVYYLLAFEKDSLETFIKLYKDEILIYNSLQLPAFATINYISKLFKQIDNWIKPSSEKDLPLKIIQYLLGQLKDICSNSEKHCFQVELKNIFLQSCSNINYPLVKYFLTYYFGLNDLSHIVWRLTSNLSPKSISNSKIAAVRFIDQLLEDFSSRFDKLGYMTLFEYMLCYFDIINVDDDISFFTRLFERNLLDFETRDKEGNTPLLLLYQNALDQKSFVPLSKYFEDNKVCMAKQTNYEGYTVDYYKLKYIWENNLHVPFYYMGKKVVVTRQVLQEYTQIYNTKVLRKSMLHWECKKLILLSHLKNTGAFFMLPYELIVKIFEHCIVIYDNSFIKDTIWYQLKQTENFTLNLK